MAKKFTLYLAEEYSEPFQVSKQGVYLLEVVFSQKAPHYTFDKVLNTLLLIEPKKQANHITQSHKMWQF